LGDTVFADVVAAYDALPESMKKRLEGLTALHTVLKRRQKTLDAGVDSYRTSEARKKTVDTVLASNDTEKKKILEAVHPVVRVHPATGRKCIYVTDAHTAHIIGMPKDESRDLIKELTEHVIKPEFLYRHSWKVNDLLMWDDCSSQHKATFDYKLPQRRVMHRTIVL
jgi:taurine dioxygenase